MCLSLSGLFSKWLKVILWCTRVSTHHSSSISQLLLYECNQSGSLSPDPHTKSARQYLCGWKGILIVKHQEPRYFIMDSKLVWVLLKGDAIFYQMDNHQFSMVKKHYLYFLWSFTPQVVINSLQSGLGHGWSVPPIQRFAETWEPYWTWSPNTDPICCYKILISWRGETTIDLKHIFFQQLGLSPIPLGLSPESWHAKHVLWYLLVSRIPTTENTQSQQIREHGPVLASLLRSRPWHQPNKTQELFAHWISRVFSGS